MTAGEVLQLPADDELVLVSGTPPIRAKKLRYYDDRNFATSWLAAPEPARDRRIDAAPPREDDWTGVTRAVHPRLEKVCRNSSPAPTAGALYWETQ